MLLWTYLLYVVYSIYAKMLSKEKNDIRFTICTFTPIESVPYVVEVYQISFLQLYYVPISCLVFLLFSFLFFLNYVHIYFLMGWNMQARALEYIENFLIKKIRFWWIVFPFYLWIIIDVLLWYVEIIIIEDFPNILIFWYSLLVWWSLSKKKKLLLEKKK